MSAWLAIRQVRERGHSARVPTEGGLHRPTSAVPALGAQVPETADDGSREGDDTIRACALQAGISRRSHLLHRRVSIFCSG